METDVKVVDAVAAPSRRSEEGFTLIEVTIAAGILAFATLGIMGMLTGAIQLNRLALQRSVATGIAAERVQRLTAMRYQASADRANYALPEETLTGTFPTYALTTDRGDVPGQSDFTRVLTLTYDKPVTGMLQVMATVTWHHLSAGEKSHQMITYLHPELEREQ